MNETDRVYVAGHTGLVGAAIHRKLLALGYRNILTASHSELDLTRQADVERFFLAEKPSFVFLAAAKVGGILANDSQPADFIRDNLLIQTNVIDSCWRAGVSKLCFLGSSCIYPKLAPQPIREEYLMSGPLEPTNEAYAIAKIAGIAFVRALRRQYGVRAISLMPTNLYGPCDNFDPTTSHVLPGLIRRFHEAKLERRPFVAIWGTGAPRREFLHVDDLADAAVFLMQTYDGEDIVNIGTGSDMTITELARTIARVVGYEGQITFDATKPDGTPRKLLDVTRVNALGWSAKIPFERGLAETYRWFCEHPRARSVA